MPNGEQEQGQGQEQDGVGAVSLGWGCTLGFSRLDLSPSSRDRGLRPGEAPRRLQLQVPVLPQALREAGEENRRDPQVGAEVGLGVLTALLSLFGVFGHSVGSALTLRCHIQLGPAPVPASTAQGIWGGDSGRGPPEPLLPSPSAGTGGAGTTSSPRYPMALLVPLEPCPEGFPGREVDLTPQTHQSHVLMSQGLLLLLPSPPFLPPSEVFVLQVGNSPLNLSDAF